jgi:hypothetical protein
MLEIWSTIRPCPAFQVRSPAGGDFDNFGQACIVQAWPIFLTTIYPFARQKQAAMGYLIPNL